MTLRSYARLTRYAAYTVVHLAITLVLLVGVVAPEQAALVLVLVSAPLLPAWGAFQGDVATNPDLDEVERSRWRIGLWLLPWSMALYWYRHVRGSQADLA
jgi:hypothetical protein